MRNNYPELFSPDIIHSVLRLPDAPLSGVDILSKAFRMRGCSSYREAAYFVWKLPYGRNSDRANWMLVLSESRGTCSTKHALLVVLAEEISLPVELLLASFMMSEENTPGVGAVLQAYGVSEIPEAHCYLRYLDMRIDMTFPAQQTRARRSFLNEHVIRSGDIGEHKERFHRDVLEEWRQGQQSSRWSLDQLWSIRNQCIDFLGSGPQAVIDGLTC